MDCSKKSSVVCVLATALCALVAAVPVGSAQTVTTGTLSGTVTDQQGGVLPGATVRATHQPTGTNYETVTESDGRFNLLNVRVGGPYVVTATLSGFREQIVPNVTVALGADQGVEFRLGLGTVNETIEVVGAAQVIDTSRAGTAGNISSDVKEALPTITRSIADIVRINPLFNSQGGGSGNEASVVSVAGNSFRYNNLQIDGAANNDLYGLAASAGTPGGLAETQPVSFDAIQEIQLVVSPYDVRQGGFSGGGINVITKSGTNDVHGTGFFFGRNQDWVGKGADDRAVSTFKDKQGGTSIGGPLVRNRAFFFGTADYARKDRPTGVSVNSTGQLFGNEMLVDRFLTALRNRYNYDPGPNPKDEFIRSTDSNKYFVRSDFNLGTNHQLTVRHNYVDGANDIGSSSLSSFRLPDAYYRFVSKTNSTVGQLNSSYARGVNELRLTYTRIRDKRAHPFDQPDFPAITVTAAPGLDLVAGTDAFSGRNELDQDIIELNDAYTMLKGTHTITVGTHNEFLKIRNLFIRDAFGTYRFASLDTFEQGLAQQFDRSFSATSDPLQATSFRVNQFGFYAGDQWRARRNLTVTYGVRMDAPRFPSKPGDNPAAVAAFGYATNVVPESVQWAPRAGANWDVRGDGSEQLRGGIGMFTGRPAYVWIANQFGNTGLDFRRIGASLNNANNIPFVANPQAQPTTVTGATAGTFTNEIDVIDPDFKFPSILRGNIGWDRQLFWNFTGTAEFVWSNTLKDIRYQNLNFTPSGGTGSGGRPFFVRRNATYSDVILLQNTDQGYNWTVSYEVRRPFTDRLFVDAAYSYGVAKTIMDGTNDQASSGWGNVYVPGDANNAPLSRSNYDPGHRINLSAAYNIPLGRGFSVNVSTFYSGQSGRPWTLTTNRDINGDNRGLNDLLYIPASASELMFSGGTYQDFANFINADDCLARYVGKIITRNACRAPWQNTLDARVAVQLPYRRIRTEVTLDMLNVINLFDSQSGLFEYQSFGQLTTFTPVPATVTTTAPLTGYNISTLTSPTFREFLRDDLRSRWQAQIGLRVRF